MANTVEKPKRYWLYVLALTSGKYYVGITTKTPERRFKEHATGFNGAAWAKKYKPLRILDRKDLGVVPKSKAEEYESRVVRQYIKKYGIENVRGGHIRVTEDLIIRYGWWWSKKDWEALLAIAFFMLIIAILVILSYAKSS